MFHFKKQLGFLIIASRTTGAYFLALCVGMVFVAATAQPLAAQQHDLGKEKTDDGQLQIKENPVPPVVPPFRKHRRLKPATNVLPTKIPEPKSPSTPPGSGGAIEPHVPSHTPGAGRPPLPPSPSTGSSTRSGPAQTPNPSAPKITFSGGTRIIQVRDGGRWIKIQENENGIVVEVTRSYTRKNHKELSRKLPELKEHVEQFPANVGNHEIQLSINVVSKYSAINAEELRRSNNRIFNLYRRYAVKSDKAAQGNGSHHDIN